MLQRRQSDPDETLDQTVNMAETARAAAESGAEKAEPAKKEEEHISLFWRVFGGTILSIVALVTITLFNNLSSGVAELRADLSREREARAELVKKDEFNTRVTAQYERMRAIDTVKVELEGLKEKVSTNTTAVDGMKRDTGVAVDSVRKDVTAAADAMRKDAAALDLLKERVVLLEGVKKDIAGLDTLKEKLTATATELTTVRDAVSKLTGDVDRNKTYDLERKAQRDSQYKQVDDSLKELQKGLQDCREKLARMEGAQPKFSPDLPIPFTRPADPSRAKPTQDATAPAKPGDVKPAGGTVEPGGTKPAGG